MEMEGGMSNEEELRDVREIWSFKSLEAVQAAASQQLQELGISLPHGEFEIQVYPIE